jgi:hypothetical protein
LGFISGIYPSIDKAVMTMASLRLYSVCTNRLHFVDPQSDSSGQYPFCRVSCRIEVLNKHSGGERLQHLPCLDVISEVQRHAQGSRRNSGYE